MRLVNAVEYCKELKKEMEWPGRSKDFIDAIECAIADLGDIPTIDAKDGLVHAYWIDDPNYTEPRKNGKYPYCSACLTTACTKHIYCPHCGAKMDGKKPNEVTST